jgi:short subunit dehydrogenase-like uncharacterized protein
MGAFKMVEIVYQLLKMALSKTEKVVASKEVVRTRTQCVLSNSNIRFFLTLLSERSDGRVVKRSNFQSKIKACRIESLGGLFSTTPKKKRKLFY